MPYDIEDELIEKYAEILQTVYDDQDAGAYTFKGILATFLRELDKDRAKADPKPEPYTPPFLNYPPGVRGVPPDMQPRGIGPRGDAL